MSSDDVGLRPDRLEQAPLLGDRAGDPALVAERMAMARLRVAPDQDLVARLEEEDLRPDPPALERAAHRRRMPAAHRRTGRPGRLRPLRSAPDRPRRARRGRAGAHSAGCRRRCSRDPRRASSRPFCRRPTGRSRRRRAALGSPSSCSVGRRGVARRRSCRAPGVRRPSARRADRERSRPRYRTYR